MNNDALVPRDFWLHGGYGGHDGGG